MSTRMRTAVFLVTAFLAGSVTSAVANTGSNQVRMCVHKKTGAVRIVSKKCAKTERAVYVNQRGVPGPAGAQGLTGSQGLPGAGGERGPTGAQGPAGLKGDDGAAGAPGLKGEKGDTGPQGTPGVSVFVEDAAGIRVGPFLGMYSKPDQSWGSYLLVLHDGGLWALNPSVVQPVAPQQGVYTSGFFFADPTCSVASYAQLRHDESTGAAPPARVPLQARIVEEYGTAPNLFYKAKSGTSFAATPDETTALYYIGDHSGRTVSVGGGFNIGPVCLPVAESDLPARFSADYPMTLLEIEPATPPTYSVPLLVTVPS